MRTFKILALVAFVFVSFMPFSAQAEEASPAPEGVTFGCEPDTLYELGEQALAGCEGDQEGSVEILMEAYGRCDEHVIVQYVGRCYLLGGDPCEAEQHYRRYRELAVESRDPFLTDIEEGVTGLERLNQAIEDIHSQCETSREPVSPPPPTVEPPPEEPPPEEPPVQFGMPSPPGSGFRIAGWALTGVGLTTLATAIPLWGVAWAEYSADPYTQPIEAQAGDALGIVGGILTGVGIVLLIVHYVRLRRFRSRDPVTQEVSLEDAWESSLSF